MKAILVTLIITVVYLTGSTLLLTLPFIEMGRDGLALQGLAQIVFLFTPLLLYLRISGVEYYGSIIGKQRLPLNIYISSILGWMGLFLIVMSLAGLQELLLPDDILKVLEQASANYSEGIDTFLGSSIPIWYSGFIVALLPAVIEESLFRGYLQIKLSQKLPNWITFLMVGLIFSAIHFNPISFLGLLCISLYLSSLRSITGSLLPSILIHFVNNMSMIYLYQETKSSTEEIQSVSNDDLIALAFTLLAGIFITVLNLYLIKKKIES